MRGEIRRLLVVAPDATPTVDLLALVEVVRELAARPGLDVHVLLQEGGPLTDAFADDWLYTTGEKLLTEDWFPALEKAGEATARVVTSGPDEDMEQIEFVALHAISCAQKSVRLPAENSGPASGTYENQPVSGPTFIRNATQSMLPPNK